MSDDAEILGERRVIKDATWNEPGDVLTLADGSRFKFKTLKPPWGNLTGDNLLAVSSLTRHAAEEWRLNREAMTISEWLTDAGTRILDKRGISRQRQTAQMLLNAVMQAEEDPRNPQIFQRVVLHSALDKLTLEQQDQVRCVAWLESQADGVGGWGSPILLSEFREITMDKAADKTMDQILSGVKALKELAGEQPLTRDKWAENPLGSREGSADYLLTMHAAGIKGQRAAALVHFGYGATRKECAMIAGASIESIKRDLKMARKTIYAGFFARTRLQKLAARKSLKKPDGVFARMKQLAKKDPDELRSIIDQMIAKAQEESDDGTSWEKTVAGLS